MKFFLLDFLNLMSCKNRDGVKFLTQFFKIRVECPFKAREACSDRIMRER